MGSDQSDWAEEFGAGSSLNDLILLRGIDDPTRIYHMALSESRTHLGIKLDFAW